MKKVVAFLFAWMFLFVLIGCKENDSDATEAALSSMDKPEITGSLAREIAEISNEVPVAWEDFVKLNGVTYCGDWRGTEVSSDCIGDKVGEVTCGVPKVYADERGQTLFVEPEDGASYLCDIGTELYTVTNRDNAIAAFVDGKYYLYIGQ